jgi:hypothetical protein
MNRPRLAASVAPSIDAQLMAKRCVVTMGRRRRSDARTSLDERRPAQEDPCRSGLGVNFWDLDVSKPGKPTDNSFIVSFNGKFRAKCLNVERQAR